MQIIDYWAKTYQLLKSLGFVLYDPEHHNTEGVRDLGEDGLVMIERNGGRNCFCVVLDNALPDYTVYVQTDIACGFVEMPVRWNEIEFKWFNDLKKAFDGKGFTKK